MFLGFSGLLVNRWPWNLIYKLASAVWLRENRWSRGRVEMIQIPTARDALSPYLIVLRPEEDLRAAIDVLVRKRAQGAPVLEAGRGPH